MPPKKTVRATAQKRAPAKWRGAWERPGKKKKRAAAKRSTTRKPATIAQLDVYQSLRRTWTVSPVTKVVEDGKRYKRSRAKSEWRRKMESEEGA